MESSKKVNCYFVKLPFRNTRENALEFQKALDNFRSLGIARIALLHQNDADFLRLESGADLFDQLQTLGWNPQDRFNPPKAKVLAFRR